MPYAPAVTVSPDVVSFFRVLADDTRLTILRLLAVTDLRAGELVERLQVPQNAVSYHLKQLRLLGLLHDRRSSRDGRDVYYSVDLERLQQLYAAAGNTLHPAVAAPATEPERRLTPSRPLRILFLCTHNRARSQLAEGIARYLGGDQVEVASAGDHPTQIHPLTLEMLSELGTDPSQHYVKHMDQFVDQQFDYIITTCDLVRGHCPTFPGDPHRIHWSLDDPSAVQGDAAAQRTAFRATRRELLIRIRYLLSFPHPATGERLQPRRLSAFEQGAQ